jgi:hypothetical protein
LAEFAEIHQNSVDSVMADFLKIGTVQTKIRIVQTKIGTVHPKFDENFEFGRVRFFATHQIFKRWGGPGYRR